jgi:hypothetical protein
MVIRRTRKKPKKRCLLCDNEIWNRQIHAKYCKTCARNHINIVRHNWWLRKKARDNLVSLFYGNDGKK